MRHLGDITQIDGSEIEPVDVITGGSPCQDLSVAGKRKGLAGERSGLFMQQIRVVKEMRQAGERNQRTNEPVRPRYMVWENVPGAFSSNGGRDFAKVLEEIIRIVETEAPNIEVPEKGWSTWGGYHDEVGGRWSVAWRLHDAQYWGVAQRRRRISVIADFGGDTAGEILFERKSVPRHLTQSGEAGGRPAADAETSSSYCLQECIISSGENAKQWGSGINKELCFTLTARGVHGVAACLDISHANDVVREYKNIAPSIQARAGTGGNQQLCTFQFQSFGEYRAEDMGSCCKARSTKDNSDLICNAQLKIRRLTPLEYERLQGFPDGWTDIGEWHDSEGKLHKLADAPRYKALGNSIALPFWDFLAKRISAQYLRPVTMGSLFDGIGGFPLVFERHNGVGTARWASEIEEFPVAVTKYHFPEQRDEIEERSKK